MAKPKSIYPTKHLFKLLTARVTRTHLENIEAQKKLFTLIRPYVKECIEKKDIQALKDFIKEMPKNFTYKAHMYDAVTDLENEQMGYKAPKSKFVW